MAPAVSHPAFPRTVLKLALHPTLQGVGQLGDVGLVGLAVGGADPEQAMAPEGKDQEDRGVPGDVQSNVDGGPGAPCQRHIATTQGHCCQVLH